MTYENLKPHDKLKICELLIIPTRQQKLKWFLQLTQLFHHVQSESWGLTWSIQDVHFSFVYLQMLIKHCLIDHDNDKFKVDDNIQAKTMTLTKSKTKTMTKYTATIVDRKAGTRKVGIQRQALSSSWSFTVAARKNITLRRAFEITAWSYVL